MSAFKLEGHTAIVTGGASGIGLATAHTLADAGATVVVADLNEEAGAETAETLKARGAAALFVKTDVAEAGDVEALVQAVTERFGSLEILMHFAGIGREILALETTLAEWNRIIAVNLTGSFLMMQAAGAVMVEAGYGRIVSMSSVAGLRGGTGRAAYGASKGGVAALTRVMAAEWAPARRDGQHPRAGTRRDRAGAGDARRGDPPGLSPDRSDEPLRSARGGGSRRPLPGAARIGLHQRRDAARRRRLRRRRRLEARPRGGRCGRLLKSSCPKIPRRAHRFYP